MRRLGTVSVFALMLAGLWHQAARAAYVPEQINYQGRITNTGGLPFNGVYNLTFAIYSAPTGGAALWTETHNGVAVANGLFSIILGTTTPITTTTLSTDVRWLGITLLPGPEMTPRTKITSVAYAIKSARSDTANYSFRSDTANYVINGQGDGLWSTSGGNVYRLSGNVGIGMSLPTERLHVDGTTRFDGPLKLKTSDQIEIAGDPGHTLNVGGACPVAIQTTDATSEISFMTSNVSRMHIDANDNIWMGAKLGLGDFSPDQRLSITGMIGVHPTPWVQPTTRGLFMYHGGTGGDIYAYNYPSGTGDPIGISGSKVTLATYSGGNLTDRVTVLNSGNVGIGTTDPKKRLHVVSDGMVLDNGGADLKFWGASDNVEHNNYLQFLNAIGLGTAMGLKSGGMLISDDYSYADPGKNDVIVKGRVGIGVTNPNTKLQIYGGALGAASFRCDNPNGPAVWIHNGANTSLDMQSTNTSAFCMKIGAGDPALPQNPALYCIGYVDVNGYIKATASLTDINAITGTCNSNFSGVAGINVSSGNGVYGSAPGPGYAGYFSGKLAYTNGLFNLSDRKYKSNISPFGGALARVCGLQGVTFEWKQNEYPDKHFSEGTQIGFIAQEVESVVPEVVSKDQDGSLLVDYAKLSVVLVEAIKELKQQNESLSKRIEALEKQPAVHTTAEAQR